MVTPLGTWLVVLTRSACTVGGSQKNTVLSQGVQAAYSPSGISEVPRPRVIMQGQLCLLTSTAQGCLLPQAEIPTAELTEFIHRRLLRTAPVLLFTLRNTSRLPLQAKQGLVDQHGPSASTGLWTLSH